MVCWEANETIKSFSTYFDQSRALVVNQEL